MDWIAFLFVHSVILSMGIAYLGITPPIGALQSGALTISDSD